MKTHTLPLFAAVGLSFVSLGARADVPPEYTELTPKLIAQMGFEYTMWRKGSHSYFDLTFPAAAGPLSPHSTDVRTRDRHGTVLNTSTSITGNRARAVISHYNHVHTDVSVSVTYCKPDSSACKEFGIRSVSRFIRENAKPGDCLKQ
jgi:hypothetical protein